MKKFTILTAFLIYTTSMAYGQSGKAILTEKSGPHHIEGAITIKLKPGIGDFEKQTGTVSFGISSLDEKVAAFEVFQLEKRFRYNPAKMRPGLPDLSRIYKISFPEKYSVNEVVHAFSSDPDVEYAEPIMVRYLAAVPNDILYAQLAYLPQIHAEQAWDIHKGENGTEEIVIAINDTGVDWDHEDLQSNIWQNLDEDADGDGHTMEYNGSSWVLDPGDLNGADDDENGFTDDLFGWNFITNNNNPNPIPGNAENGHGTHCAGLAAGATNNHTGIASISWNLNVMALCVGQNGGISYGNDGIIYAAEKGADIISNSWGSAGYSQAEQDVINYATGLGSIVLACAHNYDNTVLIYPASYQHVISVAAVTVDDAKTPYSNYNLAVDISAPGGIEGFGLLSTIPDNLYGPFFGTSMATPIVAGCLGLLKSYHPDWSNDQLITRLLGTADNIDSLNQKYVNMLGTGRVNAFRMLSEDGLPFLKLDLISMTPADENGNGICEPGEMVTLNFDMHNYAQGLGAEDVNVSITTEDAEITIINGSYNLNIPSDTTFNIKDQLKIQLSPNASSHVAKLALHFDTDIPVLMGQEIEFEIVVAPSGILVFEGEEKGNDQSGTFIAGFLDHLDFDYTYSNTLTSLLGFETAFLSFGNIGQHSDKGVPFNEDNSLAIQQFLENGGNLYLEMGGWFYKMATSGISNVSVLKQLFGVNSVQYSTLENPIDTLLGVAGTLFDGMIFPGSDQLNNWRIDKLTPAASANTPFYEKNYGNVAIMNDGSATYGHKTFFMGYTLAELHDNSYLSSRYNVLLETMEFFGYTLPDGYVLANFQTDFSAGAPPLQVQFTDFSIGSSTYLISSWQWDFDNDDVIDSYERNPLWTYNFGGTYDVRLIVSNGVKSDTLVKEELINVNEGYLVYEGVPGGPDYSGTFIRDYLQENTYSVTYCNTLPRSLAGFSAVFLSFGNYGSGGTRFDDRMAKTVGQYIESGGYVYLEGGDALGYDQADNTGLLGLFALEWVDDGTTNAISELAGRQNTITDGLIFFGNSQTSNAYIDKYQQSTAGRYALTEDNYAKVAVQQIVPGGRRTFCFSYTLACLNDGEYPNTRVEFLNRILNFFDIYTGEPEIGNLANRLKIFPNPSSDKITISPPAFTGISNLSIFNLKGEKVLERQLNETEPQINISALPQGIYFIKLQDEKMVEVGKFIRIR